MPDKRNILTVHIVKELCTCQDIFFIIELRFQVFCEPSVQ